jgi:hypothetical protein
MLRAIYAALLWSLSFCILRVSGDSDGGSGGNQTTSTTTQNTDKRQVVDGSSVGVSSDSSTVNVTATSTDHESIAKSFDLAKTSTAATLDTLNKALGFASDNLKLVQESAGNVGMAYKTASEISTGQRFLVAGGLVIAGIVAIHMIKKKAA